MNQKNMKQRKEERRPEKTGEESRRRTVRVSGGIGTGLKREKREEGRDRQTGSVFLW